MDVSYGTAVQLERQVGHTGVSGPDRVGSVRVDRDRVHALGQHEVEDGQYLSPEQARGEAVDARSDVYASGCVLYELLCGQPPFVGDSPVSVAYQHVREDPKAPSHLNRDVPPPVDAIVLKALAKNPLNRYQSAAEMRADVLRAAAGRPVYAEPVLPADAVGATQVVRTGPPGPRTGVQAR